MSKERHLTEEPSRPHPPVVLLKSGCVTVASQQRSALGIVPEIKHGAYYCFGVSPGDDQTGVVPRTSCSAKGSGVVITGIPNAPYSITLVGKLQWKLGRSSRRLRPASAPLMWTSAA